MNKKAALKASLVVLLLAGILLTIAVFGPEVLMGIIVLGVFLIVWGVWGVCYEAFQ